MTANCRPLLLTAQLTTSSHAGEILDSHLRLTLPTVAPGQTPGALRFVSLALHILSHKGERRRRYVSARKVSEFTSLIRKLVSLKLYCKSLHTLAKKSQRTTSLDELAEPN